MKTENTKEKISWQKIQDEMAEKSGLAVVLIDDNSLSNISASNNNSICELLTKSEKFIPKCQQFCGKVYENATEANKPLKYKCYAGLECVAVPIKNKNDKQFVVITGRTFVKSEDYRKATERAVSGDWNSFPPTKFFENVLMSGSSQNLENLAKNVSSLTDEEKLTFLGLGTNVSDKKTQKSTEKVEIKEKNGELSKQSKILVSKQSNQKIKSTAIANNTKEQEQKNLLKKTKIDKEFAQKNIDESRELVVWRSLFNSLLDLEYKAACDSILQFLKKRYGISSLAWLENRDNKLQKILAIGQLESQEIQISMSMDDERMLELIRKESSIELKERNSTNLGSETQRIRLFPISVGGEVRSGLVIGEKADDKKIVNSIARFCQTVASELEILRLREELSKRSWLEVALQKFNESLKMIDADDFWSQLMQTTAELLQAERGSLLVYNEKAKRLVVKSAIGSKSDYINNMKSNVGEKVSAKVWKSGNPLVMPSIRNSSFEPAPPEWKYKTESFISFPISIGKRKIGVLNLADKVDGSAYTEFDLQLLQSIVPQIAVAIDHATLKNKAGEFEQLSVTDPLTGLLNRRYLQERLDEEIKRSNRHGYPMSFMMIDVDDFKSYNDKFLHPEGDKALQIVGQCLRETLRGADIAARYGGEEFSILLPQTTLDEGEIIAERIRRNIESTQFPNRQVTVSIGIASISLAINSVADLIASADKALFEAKEKGKNNVQIFEDQRLVMRLPN